MDNKNSISYTFDDIKRYKQGLMSREEMHAFERASMEDPFLSDALEGYMEADTTLADQHLQQITEKINGRQEEKSEAIVVSMPKKGFAMWRVAAMVIVIAGAGLLTYQVLKKDPAAGEGSGGPMAGIPKETTPAPVPNGAANSGDATVKTDIPGNGNTITPQGGTVSKNDATTTYNYSTVPEKKTEQNENIKNEVNDLAVATPWTEDKKAVASSHTAPKPASTADSAPVAEATAKSKDELAATRNRIETINTTKGYINTSNQNNQFQGTIYTANNQPVANASFSVENSKKKLRTDNAGRFYFNAGDSVVNATITSGSFAHTNFTLRANTNNNVNLGSIVMVPDSAFEKTVTVVAIGSKKNKVTDVAANKPVGGWVSFQDYVAKQLGIEIDSADTEDDNTYSNSAEVEFVTDSKGIARKIKVLNITDAARKKEIIEAIQKGPKWTGTNTTTRILLRY